MDSLTTGITHYMTALVNNFIRVMIETIVWSFSRTIFIRNNFVIFDFEFLIDFLNM